MPVNIAHCNNVDKIKRLPGLETYDDNRTVVWNVLTNSLVNDRQDCRVAILGNPGSGKTTILRHLAISYASNTQKRYHKRAPRLIPVLIYLKDVKDIILSKNPKHINLSSLVEQQEWIQRLKPQPGWFEVQLSRKKCLVLLDGLDEVSNNTELKKIGAWIDDQILKYNGNTFILTSRPLGYEKAGVKRIDNLQVVQPLDRDQVRDFIKNWYIEYEKKVRNLQRTDLGVLEEANKHAGDLTARVFNKSFLRRMSKNPLLLTMILLIHSSGQSLPKSRASLYDSIFRVLLSRRHENDSLNLEYGQKLMPLQALAFSLMKENKRGFKVGFAKNIIQDSLLEASGRKDISTKAFLDEIEENSSLIVQREIGYYEFSHRSFQEYLTSLEIGRLNQIQLLIDNLEEQGWSETIRLFASNHDPSPIVTSALALEKVSAIKIAYECLLTSKGHLMSPYVRQRIENWVEENINSKDSKLSACASEIKLLQRIDDDSFEPINRNAAISHGVVTCCEYQIFVEECSNKERHYYPDSLRSLQFSQINAQHNVSGIRLSDAQLFCQWLTDRYLEKGLSYRLPTLNEEKYAIGAEIVEKSDNGCWCSSPYGWLVNGLDKSYVENLELYVKRFLRKEISELENICRGIIRFDNEVLKIAKNIHDSKNLHEALKNIFVVNFESQKFKKFGINFGQASSCIAGIRIILEVSHLINEVRGHSTAYSIRAERKFAVAKEKMRDLANDLSQASFLYAPRLNRIGELAREFSGKSGLGNVGFDDSYKIRLILKELLHLLSERIGIALAHLYARVRDLKYILGKSDLKVDLLQDIEQGISLLKGLRKDLYEFHSNHNFKIQVTAFSTVDGIKDLSRKIGYSHSKDNSLSKRIERVSSSAFARSKFHDIDVYLREILTLLLMSMSYWYSLSTIFYADREFIKANNTRSFERKLRSSNYRNKRDDAAKFYIHVAILLGQRNLNLPTWGSIRIVREILDTDEVIFDTGDSQ